MKRLTLHVLTLAITFALAGCHGHTDYDGDSSPAAADGVASADGKPRDGAADGAAAKSHDGVAGGASDSSAGNASPAPTAKDDARWLRDMASQDTTVLGPATDYFAETYDDHGLQVFLARLDDADVEVRRGAMYGVYSLFDPADERMLSAAQSALDDDDPVVRRVGLKAMALENFPRQKFLDSITRIARLLDDEHEPDPPTRAQVARMLAKHLTKSQPALPALNEAVRSDPNYNVRSACLYAIYNIARNAEEALPAPTYVLLHDADPRLRRVGAKRLGSYGAASAPSVPQLIAALADAGVPARAADDPLRGKDEPVCIAAADALALIGKPAVGPLIEALKSQQRTVRLLSIRALGDIGPDAKDAVAPLKTLSQSSDPGEATAAKAALIRIGHE